MARKLLWFSVALVAVLAGVWLAFERGGGDSNDVRPAQVARPSGDDVNTAPGQERLNAIAIRHRDASKSRTFTALGSRRRAFCVVSPARHSR
jgi:hypothetical protein